MRKNDIFLRLASKEDANDIHTVMNNVYNGLENKDLFVPDNLDFIKEHIEKNGFTVLACNRKNEIVGFFIIRFPFSSEDNLAKDLDFDVSSYSKVVHMESCAVLPKYRGQHLQLKMLQYAEKKIDPKNFQYLFATVSPDNPASYKTFEAAGYHLQTTKEKYHGKLRRIYMKRWNR